MYILRLQKIENLGVEIESRRHKFFRHVNKKISNLRAAKNGKNVQNIVSVQFDEI